MKIVRYRCNSDMDVQFLDEYGYIKRNTIYRNFIKGEIKNPYDKTICEIGCIGDGKYPVWVNNHTTLPYQTWQAMLRRCYDPYYEDKQPSYYGISEVCEEWLIYQNFAQWFEKHYYQAGKGRMHLDKDILVKGNKIYSPDRCMIVPQRINMMFLKHRPNKYNLPNGVKPFGDKFEVSYEGKKIGVFDTVNECLVAHDKAKKIAITKLANEFREEIPKQLYNALINWEPDYLENVA